MSYICGIDWSLSCPALCLYQYNIESLTPKNCLWYVNQEHVTKKETKFRKEHSFSNIFFSERFVTCSAQERYHYLADWAMSILMEYSVKFVIIENYALAGKGRVFDIAESTGLLKHLLYKNNIEIEKIEPTVSKIYFAGKGNAKKADMIQRYNSIERTNLAQQLGYDADFTGSPVSDIVDSFALIYTHIHKVV